MNVNWIRIGRITSVALPIIGAIVGSVVGEKQNEKTTVETTKKLFEEYVSAEKK